LKGQQLKKKVLVEQVVALKSASGWSTQEMANYLGVTVRAVQMWLSGNRAMPVACYELALLRSRISGETPAERDKVWQQFIEDAERSVRQHIVQSTDQ